MLHKLTRHGFEFWEAPRNAGPVFEDIEREAEDKRRALWDATASRIEEFVDRSTSKTRFGKRREDPNDRRIWGDLVELSDDEPTGTLEAFGIPRDKETLARRGTCEPNMTDIQNRVIEAFEVTQQEFFDQNKRSIVTQARNVSMALCCALTNRTIREIGNAHGRNHGAVVRAVKRVSELRRDHALIAARLGQIEAALSQQYSAQAT